MKYTYIQLEVGYYEINYKLNSNYKVGNSWADYLNGDWVELNDAQLKFKEDNPNASIEEVYKMEIVVPEPYVPTLDEVKQNKIAEITAYDKSIEVNAFILNGVEVWLEKNDRVGLMNSTVIEKNAGRTDCTLWFDINGIPTKLIVNCDVAIGMLQQLEIYAKDCYNVTAEHKANVLNLNSIDEINAYDYKVGYPVKLNFEIGDSDAKKESIK